MLDPKFEIPGGNFRWFYAGRNGRNQGVRFCWSTVSNAAGYYVGWRVIISPTTQAERQSHHIARRTRRDVKAWVIKNTNEHVAAHLLRSGLPYHVRLGTKWVSAADVTRWMRDDRPGQWEVTSDADSRLYAFEDGNVAFEFKNAFG